jgi:hypothetical protein
MSDANFQDFSTVQSDQNALPNTIASAATIAPVHKFTRVTGTTEITKITPPVSGYCEITLVFTSAYANALQTGGSGVGAIAVAYTSVANRPIDLCYDPRTTLWYPKAVV